LLTGGERRDRHSVDESTDELADLLLLKEAIADDGLETGHAGVVHVMVRVMLRGGTLIHESGENASKNLRVRRESGFTRLEAKNVCLIDDVVVVEIRVVGKLSEAPDNVSLDVLVLLRSGENVGENTLYIFEGANGFYSFCGHFFFVALDRTAKAALVSDWLQLSFDEFLKLVYAHAAAVLVTVRKDVVDGVDHAMSVNSTAFVEINDLGRQSDLVAVCNINK
jgi:hypothetical protein